MEQATGKKRGGYRRLGLAWATTAATARQFPGPLYSQSARYACCQAWNSSRCFASSSHPLLQKERSGAGMHDRRSKEVGVTCLGAGGSGNEASGGEMEYDGRVAGIGVSAGKEGDMGSSGQIGGGGKRGVLT
jgi:hypothetical protein